MLDPFAILGLERRFDLAPSDVRRAFLIRSGQSHPDVAGDDPEQLEASAELNQAKELLENPESRADTLLRLLGGPTREAERSLPPGFLEEMMELRETIDAEIAADAGARAKWTVWADGRRAGHERETARLFASLSGAPAPAELKAIRTQLNAWRYVERLIEQLNG